MDNEEGKDQENRTNNQNNVSANRNISQTTGDYEEDEEKEEVQTF